jgi:hypothetical protein
MTASSADSGPVWRASVATYNRVVFRHPQDGTPILALERKATVVNGVAGRVQVRAQPFGGAVRILNTIPLQRVVGKIRFDSERSKCERDLRILIAPSMWEALKQYCVEHLAHADDPDLESHPHRELAEEFEEVLNVSLKPDQYTVRPLGFVAENNPTPTRNANVHGQPTVRLYRIFEVQIVDAALCGTMLAASQGSSDEDLGKLAWNDFHNGGRGRANSILALPLGQVIESYLRLPPESRFSKITRENHELDESVLAVLPEVDVPQYERM